MPINVKNKRVPKLRFPEFSDEWEEKILGTIATFSKGKNLSKEDISDNGRREAIRYGELYTRYSEIIRTVYSRTNLDIEDLVTSIKNDVILPASGETRFDISAAACILIDGVILGSDINIIRSTNNGVFLSYYLNSVRKKDISQLAQGNSIVHLYPSQLKKLLINLPSLTEQKKITNFLVKVEEEISLQQSKLNLLRRYKKGIMQQIFTQKIRFRNKDGGTYPKWQRKKLTDIGQVVGGGTPDTTKPEYWNGNINWFTPTEIKQKYADTSKRKLSSSGLKNSSAGLLPMGTLLLTSRATIADISISQVVTSTNQGFQNIIVNKENLNEFVYYWILNNKKEFLRRANGSTFLEISGNDVRNITGLFPSLPEQHLITDFLSSIDVKISITEKKIRQAKRFKSGLLQQMFL